MLETPSGKKSNIENMIFPWEKDLNTEQRLAVENCEGPLLVLAGAGSGKTRVIAYRIAYLIASGKVNPDKILALTFTNKAANEMKARVMKLVSRRDSRFWIGTFHSIFARILRREASYLGYTSAFSIYDESDQQKSIKEVIKSKKLKEGHYSPQQMIGFISKLKSRLITPAMYEELDSDDYLKKEILSPVYSEYTNHLKSNNAMDFDDLLLNTYRLFQSQPALLEAYQKRFKYVLVDEFQDTNFAQYQILLQLAAKHHNICAVGDDDQSIYKWRGAEIKNILQFEHDFKETRVIRLEQNYRSTKNVLNAANSIIQNNKIRHGKKLWTDREPGEKITLRLADTDREEAGYIVESIIDEVKRKKCGWGDIAILYRLNSLSRLLEDNLRSNDIQYTIVGGLKFYDRKEIKDVLAYLCTLVNPDDSLSLKRIINYPHRGLGKKTLEKIQEYADSNGITFYNALGKTDKITGIPQKRSEVIGQFHKLISKYRKLRTKVSLVELVSTLIEEAQIMHQLQAESVHDSVDRMENVRELLRAIDEYVAKNPEATLEEYLSEIALVSDIDSWDESQQRVSLMTVHSAKGLEFPIVFLTGLEDGIFPIASSFEDPELEEEERRLMYVAATRAKDKLYMSASRSRWKFDTVLYNRPSRFLNEIDKETIFRPEFEPALTFHSPPRESYRSERPKKYTSVQRSNGSSFDDSIYAIGMKVSHVDFGVGIIRNIEGSGEKAKLEVMFEGNILKKLLVQYASLNIL